MLLCCSIVQVCTLLCDINKVYHVLWYGIYLGGERKNRNNFVTFDLDLDSESRIGKLKRDLELRKIGKITIQNRKSNLDLLYGCK